MKADRAKAIIASYWRYHKQCPFVALEASCRLRAYNDGGQADVLAINKNRELIETEVKMSLADLRRDRNKRKHQRLNNNDGSYPTNYFYFAVPGEIANKAYLICDDYYPYAGVLGLNSSDYFGVVVYRRARIRREAKLGILEITRMSRAQSATLCRLAEQVATLKERLENR